MRIAVISDIHGNMEALNAVLEDIKLMECDKIFALGDYAMAGPQPTLATEWFMNNPENLDITMIQGNTDSYIAEYSEGMYEAVRKNAPIMAEALKNDVKILSPEQKEFLKNLPAQLEVEIDGIKFLLVHGSPRKNNENILPETTMEEVEEMLAHTDANIVLCGHTHIPCGFQTTKRQTAVNAGSVGRPFTERPDACYLTVTIEDGKYVFQHRFVKYDKEAAANKLKNRQFEGSDMLANNLLNPLARHF